jgi:hypothetical protein
MSIELEAQVRVAATLSEVLARAHSLLPPSCRNRFTIESAPPASDIVMGPFAIACRGYKNVFSIWNHGYLRLSNGPIATVSLVIGYRAFPHEIEPGPDQRPAFVSDNDEELGYQAIVNAGLYRTRASFCLAALLITAIAERNRSSIVDEIHLLKHGRIVEPSSIAAMFARYSNVNTFELLSDAFCDDIDFQRSWPRAPELLADLQRSSH